MKKEKDKKKKRDQKQAASQAARQDAQPAEDSRPLDYFLSVAGGKWKLRILWAPTRKAPPGTGRCAAGCPASPT